MLILGTNHFQLERFDSRHCQYILRKVQCRRKGKKARSCNNIHLIAILKISFLLSFLSGGCVGTNRRSSAKAPLTFCWRHLSRQLVNSFRGGRRTHGLRASWSSGRFCWGSISLGCTGIFDRKSETLPEIKVKV